MALINYDSAVTYSSILLYLNQVAMTDHISVPEHMPPPKRQKIVMTAEQREQYEMTLDSQPRSDADFDHDPYADWYLIHVQLPASYPDSAGEYHGQQGGKKEGDHNESHCEAQ